MDSLEQKFRKLGVENAPGQEASHEDDEAGGSGVAQTSRPPVDFSHGDVDAFTPAPGALEAFNKGVRLGGEQAYTEYLGKQTIRDDAARKLSAFTGATIDPDRNLVITPGTQGALFLAMGSAVARDDKVAIVEPDYFANRKLVHFFDGEVVPIPMDYFATSTDSGLNLQKLEEAFANGVKLFLFSNPNNPTGALYSPEEINEIAKLATRYGVTLIVDELYSRQVFSGQSHTHLCAQDNVDPEKVITISGPSKTESLSGYRLGVAFGSAAIIDRMEKLQAIVSLRAPGYNQAVLQTWFSEPEGWMEERIKQHQDIRDDLVAKFQAADGFEVRATDAGSYLFPRIAGLRVSIEEFTRILRLQENIVITPGTEFGPQFTESFRINFSQDHEAASDAIDRLINVAAGYRG